MLKLMSLSPLVLGVLLVFSSPAYAYLDPAMGSYIVQILAGILLGAVYAVKVYWQRLRMFFGGLRKLPIGRGAKVE